MTRLADARRHVAAVLESRATLRRIERNAAGLDAFGRFAALESLLIDALRDTESALDAIETARGQSYGERRHTGRSPAGK